MPDVAAGAKAVVRARQVIVFGPTGAVVGVFVYAAGTIPGPGNPPVAWMTNQSADSSGNAVTPVIGVGRSTDQSQIVLEPGSSSVSAQIFFFLPINVPSLSNSPNIAAGPAGGSGLVDFVFSGPALTGAGINDWVQIITYSNDNLGTFARGELRYIDTSGAAHVLLDWGKSDQAVHIPAGGGPFISNETFHDVSGGSGNTARVKKLPWNKIALDVQASWAGTGTTTMGSLPDASYYPTQARQFALASNASVAQNARVFVPTSGALQIVVSGGASNGQGGCSVDYPTN